MFKTDKEYLEKKKQFYAKQGLKIDNEEKILKDRGHNNKIIFWIGGGYLLFIIFVSGMGIGVLISDTGTTVIMPKDILDKTCKELYGTDYKFLKIRPTEESFDCMDSDIIIRTLTLNAK